MFNGFLLSANLDALFDRFLISFDESGRLLVSPTISPSQRDALNLRTPPHLRWLAPEHARYLAYHRERVAT